MESTAMVEPRLNVERLAQELGLPTESVGQTLELLDDGNTVPFITRYRKDRTGGLDEEAVIRIKDAASKTRMLLERRETILKSIASQGKLTDELEGAIRSAQSAKLLEELYLPFRPKKQSLATIARQRGLEPLSQEVLVASPAAADLERRAGEFINALHELQTTADVLAGVGHILAEGFSERTDVRGTLRQIIERTGKLCTRRYVTAETPGQASHSDASPTAPEGQVVPAADGEPTHVDSPADGLASSPTAGQAAVSNVASNDPRLAPAAQSPTAGQAAESPEALADAPLQDSSPPTGGIPAADSPAPPSRHQGPIAAIAHSVIVNKKTAAERRRQERKEARERKRRKLEHAFKDYFQYEESLSRIPPHRVMAINRGERTGVLRVKINADVDAMQRAAQEMLVPAGHPHAGFLCDCVRDSLARLVIPALEREVRRELTQLAEEHAISVFARNLRQLLLQPPVRGRRVLALDPGFRNGCKLAALDEFGNVLAHELVYVIGPDERRKEGRARLVEMIRQHAVRVVAIGNGSGCRDAEQLVADVIAEELNDSDLSYVIVNEAGASVYSTSDIGREELADYDATLRGAISIGRRLLDPLSELVKIHPSNIGVGLYQHDVKSKALQASLDAVVESCVNYVGVEVNTASPALLSYVSGLNKLTARRLYEYRCQNGRFVSREQIKEVPGIGEATFVQATGFLKIVDGANPLDATWIHPESYAVAEQVLAHIDSNLTELAAGLAHVARKPVPPEQSGGPVAAAADSADGTETHQLPADLSQHRPGGAEERSAEGFSPDSTNGRGGKSLAERVTNIDVDALSRRLGVGQLLLKDILSALSRPGRDPRDDLPPPSFRRGILKLDDLEPGMELSGTVLNVVDFGAFVDIGLSETGLVHISRLADRYVRDPHEVVSVADVLPLWVLSVDKERRRISLTAIKPGTEKPRKPRREQDRAEVSEQVRPGRPERSRRAPWKSQTGQRRERQGKKTHTAPPRRETKPVVPITKAMEEGKEPMRTFSDLKQFYQKKVMASQSGQNDQAES
jgi:uncharacterized protein